MNHVYAIPGDYNTWSAFTIILELLGLLLSHAGEFNQCLIQWVDDTVEIVSADSSFSVA